MSNFNNGIKDKENNTPGDSRVPPCFHGVPVRYLEYVHGSNRSKVIVDRGGLRVLI